MQQLPINSDGYYTGRIIDHAVEVNDETGSIALAVQVMLERAYDNETKTWDESFSEHEFYAYGRIYLVGQGGVIGAYQKKNAQTIKGLFNWDDGMLPTLQQMELSDTPVMVFCKTSSYEGKDSIKVDSIDFPAAEPRRGGGLSKADDNKLAALSGKYASQFRAIAAAKPKATDQPTFATSAPVDNGPGF